MRFPRMAVTLTPVVVLLLTAANNLAAQEAPSVQSRRSRSAVLPDLEGVPDWLKEYEFGQEEFTFVRIQYDSTRRRVAQWATDFPDADINLVGQLAKLTSLKVASEPEALRVTEVNPVDHPFVYLSEGGHWELSDAELTALRRYLTGGGFLMLDDFWGENEWEHVERELSRVFPNRSPTELSLEHPIFHCVFDLKEKPQVPSIAVAIAGRNDGITFERRDAMSPHYRAITDDDGRIMVLICHNTDLGDGWERAGTDQWYTAEFSVKRAFPMGINAIFYALTH